MPNRSVLFLDVDGVLNNGASIRAYGWHHIDSFRVDMVRDVIMRTDSRLVLSSTWRFFEDFRARVMSNFANLWHNDTMTTEPSRSGVFFQGGYRGREIQEWLQRHPEVTQYAIVDDDAAMLPEQLPFFVKTNFDTGITAEHCRKLYELLIWDLP